MRQDQRSAAAGTFVGRNKELAQLDAALSSAATGRGGLWLVAGEPGIGKTRLVTELADRAGAAGARVLWGRCRELQGAPAYWPWSQVLGTYLRGATVAAADLALLSRMVPGLAEDPPRDDPGPPTTGQDRFYLFDAVGRTLRTAAEDQPLVVVLEDLHAADPPSLRLLQFLTAELGDAAILILATTRPTTGDGATDALHDAVRPAQRVALSGLSRDELEDLLEWWGPSPDVVTAVWDATGGNPFFALETARLLATEGRLAELGPPGVAVPEGVRHTLRQRLAALSEDARAVVETAAVLGRRFDLVALVACLDRPLETVVAALGEAAELGVLARPRIDLGTYRFAHALVRETVYGDLPPARRLRLHGRVGEALTARYGADIDAHLDELAGHFLLAAPVGYHREAVDLAVRAGRAALADLAYEPAVRFFRQALELLAADGDVDAVGEVQLALGHALLRAGEPDDAKATFLRLAQHARTHARPRLLAQAALGYGGQWTFSSETTDETGVGLIESALAALPDDERELRARLLARLAGELHHSEEHARATTSSARAVEIARELGDPATLATALLARVTSLWRPTSPDNLAERLRLDREAIRLAERIGDQELLLGARSWRIIDLLEAGDVVGADAQIAAFTQAATALRQPFYLWFTEVFAGLRALMRGQYAAAEEHACAALAAGERAQGRRELAENAVGAHVIQLLLVRRERGSGGEPAGDGLAPVHQAMDRFPQQPAWRAATALRELATGNTTAARTHYGVLAADDFRALVGAQTSLVALCLTADLAASLRDGDGAARLYARLAPFAGHHVVIGLPAIAYYGAVDLYLGLLAATHGDTTAARDHLTEALRAHSSVGAAPWVARTQHELARVHLARGGAQDRARAAELLAEARRIAEDLGMAPLQQRIAAVAVDAPAPAPPDTRPTAPAVLRLEGEVWTVTLGPETVRVQDVKGMHYLHRLLRHPGRELHVLDLTATTARGATSARAAAADGMSVDDGALGPLLDAQAKGAYRRRLLELRADVAEAEDLGDTERAARGQEEIDALARELSRAIGLGGRDRATGSPAERARVNVSRAIRSAIGRIAAGAPSLGHHLSTSVRTGTYCVYAPDPAATPDWDLGQPSDRRSPRANARPA